MAAVKRQGPDFGRLLDEARRLDLRGKGWHCKVQCQPHNQPGTSARSICSDLTLADDSKSMSIGPQAAPTTRPLLFDLSLPVEASHPNSAGFPNHLAYSSEIKLQRQLYPARVAGYAVANAAEDGTGQHSRRIVERRMVCGVLDIASDLQIKSLVQAKLL
jgi:hypothetical protein